MSLSNHKFILIDDNEIDLLLHHKIIALTFPNATIHKFMNGESALEFFMHPQNSGPYTVLLDIKMPVMDGFQFLDAFNLLPPNIISSCTIYLLSSSTNQFDISRANANQLVNALITKPFSKDQLLKLMPSA